MQSEHNDISFFKYFCKTSRNIKRGIIAAKVTGGKAYVGWCLCRVNKGDVFDRELGLKIAQARIEKNIQRKWDLSPDEEGNCWTENTGTPTFNYNRIKEEIPHSMHDDLADVLSRCGRIISKQEAHA